ncbi:MAG: riboflavin synthase, partial [Alphaproteobacteria bacterium]|nr:riboflavin synthase [Alphaproteobacteria bacterium]
KMFTGIITHIGELTSISEGEINITTTADFANNLNTGASIAANGCCLTLTQNPAINHNTATLAFNLSPETIARTTFAGAKPAQKINLERSARLGDEIGGHIVTGHIDSTATVTKITDRDTNRELRLKHKPRLAKLIAEKGAVALNGVSLTVNSAARNQFSVMLVPHTLARTNLGDLRKNDAVNLETDPLARYVTNFLSKS